MHQELSKFWDEARRELNQICGQIPGKRDLKMKQQRDRIAANLRLNSRTLKGFLNGNQKSLGPEGLMGLFALVPQLENSYKEALGHQGAKSMSSVSPLGDEKQTYIQTSFRFDGFEESTESLVTHLPPGREGSITIKIKTVRLA